ncbi:MAG: ERF family protein, partial [bacterium]|nr:ERF family protein [bacterium]
KIPATLTRSDAVDKLAAALAKAQSTISFASKDATNPHFKSKYADLAAVWEAVRVPLSSNGLAVVQFPSADGLKVTLTTVLLHESGQWMSQDLTMMASANTPQAVGSTITYARRYALSSVAGVAQDDDDGNAGSGKGGKQ